MERMTHTTRVCAQAGDGRSSAGGAGNKQNPMTQLLIDHNPAQMWFQLLETQVSGVGWGKGLPLCRAQFC